MYCPSTVPKIENNTCIVQTLNIIIQNSKMYEHTIIIGIEL
jgi:hypothetical protein